MKGTGIFSTKVFIKFTLIVLSIVICLSPAWAGKEKLTVMTRNLYIGANIQSLAQAPDLLSFILGVQDALEDMEYNNFSERAMALAAEIVEKKPHLVGLQEVYNITSSVPTLNGSPPFLNYLDELKDELFAQGACYYEAAIVTNLDLSGPSSIPTFLYGLVSVTDRDVILKQCDVETTVVDLSPVCPEERQSEDGCNYADVLEAPTAIGPLAFQRGFVAVDAQVGDFELRFFNTHLEVRYPDPANLASSFFQAAQASELISIIDLLPPLSEGAPVIVVGDINSSPEDEVIDLGAIPIVPPYMQFVDIEGYTDAWTFRPGKHKSRPGKRKGYTCCQDEDLLNKKSALDERIDVIFSSELPDKVKAKVVGNHKKDKTPSGLWPSDHAGVVAKLHFKHFKAKRRR